MNTLVKVENLTKEQLEHIPTQIGEAFAAEKGGITGIISHHTLREYIKIATEIAYESGYLYTIDYKGYIVFYPKNKKIPLRYHFKMAYKVLKRIPFSEVCKYIKGISGWIGYEKIYRKQDYIAVFMLAIPLEFQGQGRMKPLLSHAFAEAEKKGVPCVLDTDTELKQDKYIKCGMHLKRKQLLKSGISVYVMER